MRVLSVATLIALLLVSGLIPAPSFDGFSEPFQKAYAQVPPAPDPGNVTPELPVDPANATGEVNNATSDPTGFAGVGETDQDALIYINVNPVTTLAEMDEQNVHSFQIEVRDRSVQSAETYSGGLRVTCNVYNQTEIVSGWSITQVPFSKVYRHDTNVEQITFVAGPRASPEVLKASYLCTATLPSGAEREVGNFTLIGKVKPYYYMQLIKVGVPERQKPDSEFHYSVLLQNGGNQVTTFIGEVESPPGYELRIPDSVSLAPGEGKVVNITGFTPRDSIYTLSRSDMVRVSFYPAESPGRVQTLSIPVQMSGFYLHPALIPLAFVAIIIIAALIFLAVLARRTVEETILGKPVPPWRIPVEREYLQTLMKEDPDQYYIVRYYLMVEEHQSALLWFEAFKKATKKDRKRESAWFKVKRKQERKVVRLEKGHNKLVAASDKDVEKPLRKADRKKNRLERKLRRKERKKQRKINRKHKKRSTKLVKKHNKRAKKLTKKFEKKRDKELRKVEKANKKREKKGEEPLPLPDLEPPVLEEPDVAEPEVVPEVPLMESRYAKRVERIQARAERKKERLLTKRDKTIAGDRRRVDAKAEKLRAKIPPEPKTNLYREDEFVPEDEIVVEDDRPFWARSMALPTLEEREEARRRNQVLRARLQTAQEANDEAQVTSLKEQMAAERRERAEARRELRAAQKATKKEDAALAKERKRAIRERAKSLKREAAEEARSSAPDETGPIPVRDDANPDASAPAKGGFKARLRRGKTAQTGDDKESASSAEPPQQDQS